MHVGRDRTRKSDKVHIVTGHIEWDSNAPKDVGRFKRIQLNNPEDVDDEAKLKADVIIDPITGEIPLSVATKEAQRRHESTRPVASFPEKDYDYFKGGDAFSRAVQENKRLRELGRNTTLMFDGSTKQWEVREWLPRRKLARDEEKGLRTTVQELERKGVLKEEGGHLRTTTEAEQFAEKTKLK